ncbi:MAG: AtpZ/AtpI family protein [Bacteroidota bacterium]
MGPPEDQIPNNRQRNEPSVGGALREYAPYLALGFQLAAAVVVFFLLGVWLDSTYETTPLFRLLGLLFGTIGGFVKFFRTIAALERRKNAGKE